MSGLARLGRSFTSPGRERRGQARPGVPQASVRGVRLPSLRTSDRDNAHFVLPQLPQKGHTDRVPRGGGPSARPKAFSGPQETHHPRTAPRWDMGQGPGAGWERSLSPASEPWDGLGSQWDGVLGLSSGDGLLREQVEGSEEGEEEEEEQGSVQRACRSGGGRHRSPPRSLLRSLG